MKKVTPILGVLLTGTLAVYAPAEDAPRAGKADAAKAKSIYDFTVKANDGKDVALAKYRGQVMLVVNVASR